MRTTLDIPKSLIGEALRLSHQKTKTAVVIAALEDFVRKNRIAGLKEFKGAVNVDIDLDALRDRK